MTTKCSGIVGRIFGHKWKVKQEVIQPQITHYGNNFYTVGNVEFIKYRQCVRCGAVTEESK